MNDSSKNPSLIAEGRTIAFLVRHRALVLTGLGLVLYITCLSLRDLWYPDEPDIAEVARAMFLSGDWIAPRRMGEIWVDYPPLLYWASSLSAHLLGSMTEFALRLPNALGAIALILVTCAVGSRWFDPKTGLWAGFLLMTFPQFALQAIGYRTDMLFSLFIGTGLLAYASGCGDVTRWWPRIAGFTLLGLAMLTKGPLGLLLPGLVLTLWHTSRREWRALLQLAPLSLVSLIIYFAWFVACANEMGADDILHELWAQNFQRFGSGFRGHKRPFYYYFLVIWYDLAPWTFLLPMALWWLWHTGSRHDRNVQLAFWWFGTFFVFLSIAATKRQVYLLPAYPAIALITGRWTVAVAGAEPTRESPDLRGARLFLVGMAVAAVIVGITNVLAAIGTGLALPLLNIDPLHEMIARSLRAPLFVLGALALAMGIWIFRAWREGAIATGLNRVAVTLFSLYFIGFAWFMPRFNPVKTYAPSGRWIRQQIGDETRFGLAFPKRGHAKMGAFGYYTGAHVELLNTAEEIERFLREHPHSLVLLNKNAARKIYNEENSNWRSLVVHELTAGRFHYFVLRRKPEA